jgi:hypothetical protein
VAIKLTNCFGLKLSDCDNGALNSFENVFPRLIAAAVRAGAFFYVYDDGIEAFNNIVCDVIRKEGVLIDLLVITKSNKFGRMLELA